MHNVLHSLYAPVWRKCSIYRGLGMLFRFDYYKYEIYNSRKCKLTTFGMRCKSRSFLGLRPRPRWEAYDAPPGPLVVRGLLAFTNRSFAPSALAIFPTWTIYDKKFDPHLFWTNHTLGLL